MKGLLLGVIITLSGGRAMAADELQTIAVKAGDTLRGLAGVYLDDPRRWAELLKYNSLAASGPDAALPAMQLSIPAGLLKDEYRAAKLLAYTRDVLFRRAGSPDWRRVSLRMDLFRSDTLYTMAASRAEVLFHNGQTLSLTPNTLVVLRPPGRKDADVEMVAGELSSRHSRIITRTATILPKTADAEFSARMKEDLTTVVRVTRGVAEVEAQGRKVEVPKGFVTEVRLNMPPSRPVEMPSLPADAPKAAVITAAPQPAPPAAAAAKVPGAAPGAELPANALDSVEAVRAYHLQVARDMDFASLVLDKVYDVMEKPDLQALLPPGNYYMRLAKIDLLGYKGKFSPPKPLRVK